MELDVNKQMLTINKLVDTVEKNVVIEGDLIVPDVKPDILNTIDSIGNVCVYKKEILDGKVRFDGGVYIYLMYLPDAENEFTRGLNTILDFTQIIEMENCKENMDIISDVKIKNIECKVLNGRKIKIKVELDFKIQLYSNENVNVLKEINNIENMQILNSKMQINNLLGEGYTKATAKDTISYEEQDDFAEILKTEVKIINKEVKTSYNKVLVKADANVKIMYLTEDGTVKIMNSNIPIMGFIDIANITDDNIINTNYETKNIIIKPNISEHSIYIEIEVGINCFVYGVSDIELIQDMYSTEKEIEFTTKNIFVESHKETKNDFYNITEQIVLPEISNNKIYDVEINTIVNNTNVLNKRVIYEGEIQLNFLFEPNGTTGIESKKYIIPFNHEIENDNITSTKNILTDVDCIGDSFNIISDGTIDCKINLQFNIQMSDANKINLIDEVKIVESDNKNNCNMIVYVVKPNDTLWSIAKKNKTTIENIKLLNNLENNNIKQGEKLYIERCDCNLKKYTA